MAEVYGVGTDGRADYTTLADIPSNLLNREGVVFELYPGEFTSPSNSSVSWNTTATFVGRGTPEDVVIVAGGDLVANTVTLTAEADIEDAIEEAASNSAVLSISNDAEGTVTFENLTIRGAGSDSNMVNHMGIEKAGTGTDTTIVLRNVNISNVTTGIHYPGSSTATRDSNNISIVGGGNQCCCWN